MNIIAQEDKIIDIYWFHPVHKYFQAHEQYLQLKGTGLPANATDIPIPFKQLSAGNIYIFKETEWIETQDNFNKPEYTEINYSFHQPLPSHFTPSKIANPLLFFPKYNDIVDYIFTFHKCFSLAKKYECVQNKYLYLKELHAKFIGNINSLQASDYHITYRIESEFFIMMIRSIFDELVQLTSLVTNNDDKSVIDSIGALKKNKNKYIECFNIIFGDDVGYLGDNTNFLTIINDLFNSIKHSSMHYDAYQMYSYTPNIVSYQKKYNQFTDNIVIYHNHSLDHLIFGFIDNFHRIIGNQKKYLLT